VKDKLPQPTAVLIKRLRRAAKAFDECALGRSQGTILLGSAEKYRAHANVCWQAAGRLEELESATKVDAVDPHLQSEGKPSTRDSTSFSSDICAPSTGDQ
jgi:hypothetical protein